MSVCYNCPKREVGCKSSCPEWKAEKDAEQEKKDARFVKDAPKRYIGAFKKRIYKGKYGNKG